MGVLGIGGLESLKVLDVESLLTLGAFDAEGFEVAKFWTLMVF